LTRELAREAVRDGLAAGRAGELCQTFLISIPNPKGLPVYTVTVITPYCEAAVLAFQAAKRHETLDAEKMSIPAENQQCVILQVGPISHPDTDFRIQTISPPRPSGVALVKLQLGDETLRPVKSALHDVAVTTVNGQMRTATAGSFTFPLSALGSGKEPVTVIVVPDTGTSGGQATTVLTPDDLRKIDRGLSRS
jgi:hypothetical protein